MGGIILRSAESKVDIFIINEILRKRQRKREETAVILALRGVFGPVGRGASTTKWFEIVFYEIMTERRVCLDKFSSPTT